MLVKAVIQGVVVISDTYCKNTNVKYHLFVVRLRMNWVLNLPDETQSKALLSPIQLNNEPNMEWIERRYKGQQKHVETDIVGAVVVYFRSKGYETVLDPLGVDITATNGNEKWVIESKGLWTGSRGRSLTELVGQTIRNMTTINGSIRYAIAIPKALFSYFRWWGVEGLRLLSIHLLLVGENGNVEHITPENFVSYINKLASVWEEGIVLHKYKHGGV